MSEEMKNLIESEVIPEVEPLPDEIEAIAEAKEDKSPTIPHDTINWD